MPREVVPMETRPGRPSDIFSIMRWAGNSTCARLLMKRLPVTATPADSSASISRQQRGRIDHQAVADHRLLARAQNAARDQFQDEFLLADENRVAGVVSALIARDNIEPFGEEIDNLPFALVSPLGAQDDYVSHFDQTYLFYRTRAHGR